jgi:hypothetical protein
MLKTEEPPIQAGPHDNDPAQGLPEPGAALMWATGAILVGMVLLLAAAVLLSVSR